MSAAVVSVHHFFTPRDWCSRCHSAKVHRVIDRAVVCVRVDWRHVTASAQVVDVVETKPVAACIRILVIVIAGRHLLPASSAVSRRVDCGSNSNGIGRLSDVERRRTVTVYQALLPFGVRIHSEWVLLLMPIELGSRVDVHEI